jgi:ABC-type uncharacterized transport system permease subunit
MICEATAVTALPLLAHFRIRGGTTSEAGENNSRLVVGPFIYVHGRFLLMQQQQTTSHQRCSTSSPAFEATKDMSRRFAWYEESPPYLD